MVVMYASEANDHFGGFNPICLRVPPAIVVWIYDTFYNNFGFENDFNESLKESCLYCPV